MPKAAVLGSPIGHSKSPLLHAAAYRALDLPWTYERHEVDEQSFPSFLQQHADEFNGLSLTMPLKRMGFSIAEVHDLAATATGAVNTLVFGDQLRGYNTDVVGFREALHSADTDCGTVATVLGTGATAQSAAYALMLEGVTELHVAGRRPEALELMSRWLSHLGVVMHGHAWGSPLPYTAVTVSAVVAGATDALVPPEQPGLLFDCIYAPWPTTLATAWDSRGGAVLSGTDLLVQQAAEQVLLMTHVHVDNRGAIVKAMYAALRALEFSA